MVDIAIHKKLARTRASVEGETKTLTGIAYTATNLATLTLPGAIAERLDKSNLHNFARGVSTGRYANTDPRNIVYDFKKHLWTWRIKGKYIGSNYSSTHNFIIDYRVIVEDGASDNDDPLEIVFQDKKVQVFPMEAQFTWTGGMIHTVDYTIDLMEGESR